MKLKDIFYIGVLKVKLFYEKIINVLILYGFCFLVFIYGFVDIYSFFILWLKIVEVINNMQFNVMYFNVIQFNVMLLMVILIVLMFIVIIEGLLLDL